MKSINCKFGNIYHDEKDQDSLLQFLRKQGEYQPYIVSLAEKYSEPDTIILDIGANLGSHTIPLARLKPLRWIEAFEAVPSTAKWLKYNVDQNIKTNNVRVHCKALGNKLENKNILITKKSGANSFHLEALRGEEVIKTTPVSVTPLDQINFSKDKRISFIKIDTQNHEFEILNGAINTILYHKAALLIEMPERDHVEKELSKKIKKLLTPIGYLEKESSGKDKLFISK